MREQLIHEDAMVTDDDGNTRVLPSGLVTFVFTDIEGSTRLYKALGEAAAQQVFDHHNELIRASLEHFDGHEVHTEGDSFFAVFEDPDNALAACVDMQRRIATATWPDDGEVRVRIGIHCGLAAPRFDDYMALAVHQAARVMSAANGGQILITEPIRERLDDTSQIKLVRTGDFRLRDFDGGAALHRVDSASFPVNDRPPRATPANHHNLVRRLTSFVGRSADVVTVNGLLAPGKAVTLVGLGGMGKTRLATEVGLEVASDWEHGVWMVELAEVADPDLIAEEIALSIGVDSLSPGDRWDDVVNFIGDKTMLIVLDNLEHLADACAELVPALMSACPHISILSTSRESLSCQGEVVYRLKPLDLTAGSDDPTELPSVQLFIDRASAVAVDYGWTNEALADVLAICQHLDGLPLAIEVAAAQVGVLQLPEIRSGLRNRFRLLRSRDRALPARQRTMEGLLGWSYQLLTETEQRAFRRLAVFAGSFSIDAAEAALAGDGIDGDDVPELIWSLVDKSLIAADLSNAATRYRLFESVQQYAMRLLIDNDDPVRGAISLGTWLLDLVAPWHVNDRRWLGDVAIEIANIRSVVDLVSDIEAELAQQLMCSVGRYHDSVQSYFAAIETLSDAAKSLTQQTPSRVAMLALLADLMLRTGNTDEAASVLDEAAATQAVVGPPAWNDVAVQRTAGELASRTGDFSRASEIAIEALDQDLSLLGEARMWNLLGISRFASGDQAAGLSAFKRELNLYQQIDNAPYIGSAHGNVAEAAWRMGDFGTAAAHQRSCLSEALALGQQVLIAYSLIMASRLAGATERWSDALQLHACAFTLLERAGHQLYDDDSDAAQSTHNEAQKHLDAEAFRKAKDTGQKMLAVDAASLATNIFDLVAQDCSNELVT